MITVCRIIPMQGKKFGLGRSNCTRSFRSGLSDAERTVYSRTSRLLYSGPVSLNLTSIIVFLICTSSVLLMSRQKCSRDFWKHLALKTGDGHRSRDSLHRRPLEHPDHGEGSVSTTRSTTSRSSFCTSNQPPSPTRMILPSTQTRRQCSSDSSMSTFSPST